jgi:hypothetical protein
MPPHTLTAQTRQRLFALFADAAAALVNGDLVNTAEVRAQADTILRDAFDAVTRACIQDIHERQGYGLRSPSCTGDDGKGKGEKSRVERRRRHYRRPTR